MNDLNNDLADRQTDGTPHLAAEAATLVPVVAESDGKLSITADDGQTVVDGDVVGYVQVDEDA